MGRELGDANAPVALIVQALKPHPNTGFADPLPAHGDLASYGRNGSLGKVQIPREKGEFVPSRIRELRSESRRHTSRKRAG